MSHFPGVTRGYTVHTAPRGVAGKTTRSESPGVSSGLRGGGTGNSNSTSDKVEFDPKTFSTKEEFKPLFKGTGDYADNLTDKQKTSLQEVFKAGHKEGKEKADNSWTEKTKYNVWKYVGAASVSVLAGLVLGMWYENSSNKRKQSAQAAQAAANQANQ